MTRARTLVLLRHGRTAWNHSGRLQGQRDVGLDDVGHDQARRTAPAIAALAPTLIWSSDLERTRQTVAPIAEACGVTTVFDARLRERAAAQPGLEVQLRADQAVPYGRIAELIGLVEEGGLSRIGFVTEATSK